jgi:hypothetical protein
MALQAARDVYTRRGEGNSIWVVPSAEITASDPGRRTRCSSRPRRRSTAIRPSTTSPTKSGTCDDGSAIDDQRSFHLLLRHRRRSAFSATGSEWCGHAPTLEEDLALANIALDLIGQARSLYTYAGEVEGKGRDEDQLAFLRLERDYRQPVCWSSGRTAISRRPSLRQLLFLRLHACRSGASDRLEGRDARRIAAKAEKEAAYHLRHSGEWTIRLGDGTEESARAHGRRRRSAATATRASCSRSTA